MRRILLTGASDGIGRAIAREYGRRGARLLLVARREALLSDVAEEVRALGGDAAIFPADVAEHATPGRAIEMMHDHFGGVDAVVMNAGIGSPTFIDDFSADECERVMEVNYHAPVRMIEAALPSMLAARSGQIVAVSSLAAYRGMPGSGPYNSSKAALTSLMESLRIEARGRGLAFTTIAPGFVRTPMTDQNEFKMPFLMEPDDAARRIARAIDARRSFYAFPLPLHLLVALSKIMPNWIYDRLLAWGRSRSIVGNRQ